mmetsp:Transcript_36006/g.112174  ORF Transcript_36006/g.112174 Transcript_36006/m.112174 type:complete len:216 (+) Transcript_36006:886-1533(+)
MRPPSSFARQCGARAGWTALHSTPPPMIRRGSSCPGRSFPGVGWTAPAWTCFGLAASWRRPTRMRRQGWRRPTRTTGPRGTCRRSRQRRRACRAPPATARRRTGCGADRGSSGTGPSPLPQTSRLPALPRSPVQSPSCQSLSAGPTSPWRSRRSAGLGRSRTSASTPAATAPWWSPCGTFARCATTARRPRVPRRRSATSSATSTLLGSDPDGAL